MFSKLGGLVDRAGWHILAVIGTVGLALISVFNTRLVTFSPALAIILTVLASAFSVVGVIVGVRSYEKRRKTTQAQLLTGLRLTLIPAAERFISIAPALDETNVSEGLTDITARCAQFVKSEDGDTPDANVYLLDGTTLYRANRAAGTARDRFKKTQKRDARSREESAVVDRVLAKQVTICDDVQSPENQEKLCLENTKRKYRAFISVPILVNSEPVGMISVNSARKNHLTDVHVAFLENIAVLVSALLAVKSDRNVAIPGQDKA
ncbi:GAF domain-containing protein [Microbacterium sp. YY-01]|uniref:GAF domain-containing protein n=1 Tax=Microbacterium sp. YY-01 TaxID=3421634 RepID=UPI003D178640